MDRLNIAFCDDDGAFRALMVPAVTDAFAARGIACTCFEADGPGPLSAALGHMTFDLIFLDIDMPGTDGIRFGEALRARGCRSDIIYVSNMEDKVYEIFRVHPWSFIRKSRFSQELPAVLDEYVAAFRSRAGTVLLPAADGSTAAVDPMEFAYAESAGKCQKLFPAGGGAPLLVRLSMRELEERFAPCGFIRIHKGFLVNYRAIRKITSRAVLLEDGGDLPVGRDRLGPARERYLQLMKWKGLDRGP